jgi:hypothetical protein
MNLIQTPRASASSTSYSFEEKEEKEASPEPSTQSLTELHTYEYEQIYILEKRFQRLHRDSVELLAKSQRYDKISKCIKAFIIVFSLASSYLSAVSGIDDIMKSYMITAFSLACAVASGMSSIKNFGNESSRLYAGYTQYQMKCSEVEQAFFHFQHQMEYHKLILSIDDLFTQFEKDIDKTSLQRTANAEKRLVYIQEVFEGKLKQDNDGELPDWYLQKIKVEDHKDRYDLKRVYTQKPPQK